MITSVNHRIIREALLIRRVEETFLELFSKGKLNGTVHTCVGQEFSAVAFAGQLKKTDFIFSNHRCHGHYLAFTKDVYGLMAELMGKRTGTSGGVGSSQHLCNGNFYSNGIQGGIVPVAAGHALSNKLQGKKAVGIVFIGDGTLGEGVLYETMNIISKWEIPLMIVCENNFYAQSTPQRVNLAGDILARPEAFGIKTYSSNTWDVHSLMANAAESIDYMREAGKPVFHLVDTYRLNAHSKGDDDRDQEEVSSYKDTDFLVNFSREDPAAFGRYLTGVNDKVQAVLDQIDRDKDLTLEEYFSPWKDIVQTEWTDITPTGKRQVELINRFFLEKMKTDKRTVFIGEDVLSPYGGAFKVAKNLSHEFPDRVFSTPISEAALTGITNGLALAGMRPYAEIMFGDFITLAFDQIVNHASKFHHMYNGKVTCPMVLRTPMGGKRGYGPTHSQTLDKFLVGIDNITTVALNTLVDPGEVYEGIHKEEHPVVVIENKTDYGKKVGELKVRNYSLRRSPGPYPVIKATPLISEPNATIVTYGTNADWILSGLEELFRRTELLPEVIVLTRISPIGFEDILPSVTATNRLYVVEEGSVPGGVGSEIIAGVVERLHVPIVAKRLGALSVPIPSVKSLENLILPGLEHLIDLVR